MTTMQAETCRICGGDGRIANAFGGSSTTCPGCHGTGRRSFEPAGFRDVTKTKPSHYQKPTSPQAAEKAKGPSTFEGQALAKEVRDCSTSNEDIKARLIREITEYEGTHGRCTQTFIKKVRKQLRPPASS